MIVIARAAQLAAAVFPPVTTTLCREMQPGLYSYLLRVSWGQQARLCALSLLLFPLSMAPLELQRQIINRAIEEPDVRLLMYLGSAYFGVLILHGGLKYVFNFYQGQVAEGVIRVLRQRVSNSAGRVDGGGQGALVSLAAAEAEQLGGLVSEGLALPFLQGGIFLTVLGYMLWVELPIAILTLSILAPSLVIFPVIQRWINTAVEARTKLMRELSDEISVDRNPDEQSSDKRNSRHNALIEKIYRARLQIFAYKFLSKFFNNFLAGFGPLAILVFGGWLVIEGETQIGTVVAFVSGFERLVDPSRQLLNFYRRLSQTRVQYQLIRKAVG